MGRVKVKKWICKKCHSLKSICKQCSRKRVETVCEKCQKSFIGSHNLAKHTLGKCDAGCGGHGDTGGKGHRDDGGWGHGNGGGRGHGRRGHGHSGGGGWGHGEVLL